jgi:predicted aspartyl protease
MQRCREVNIRCQRVWHVVVLSAGLLAASACSPLTPGTIDLASQTTVPFDLHGNHIYVRASIDGQPYAFVLDTGGVASLTPELAASLHLATTGSVAVRGVGDGSSTVQIVRVPEIDVGGLRYRDGSYLVLPGLPLESPFGGVRFGGILGRELFEKLVVKIDYQHEQLSFIQPAAFTIDPRSVALPVTMRRGAIPSVKATVDGKAGDFDIDAGSGQAVTLTQQFAESSGLEREFGKSVNAEIGRGVGGALSGTVSRARMLSIATFTLLNPIVEISATGIFADSGFAGNIGAEILRRFTITLDVPADLLYLRPNRNYAQPFLFNRAGLSVFKDASGLHVTSIISGSPAAQAGIAVGDALVSVNGRPASRLDMAALHDIWYGRVGDRVAMRLSRKGRIVRAAFELRDLI